MQGRACRCRIHSGGDGSVQHSSPQPWHGVEQICADHGLISMQRRFWLEIAGLLCAFFAVFCLLQALTDTQRFHLKANDCYQYLSMAHNIRTGNGIATSLLHYSENQGLGLIPSPQTVFPPGYSIVIAGLEFLGLDGVAAGVGISLTAFAC